uniref:TSA: Wollemia nobilis Ref_Wollemi_Transcript_8210_2097 transcribed RNA sequence n=1 Tax=Wollemia nobilis TaxID=56998 RepID=A0A0C9RNK3_9CONI
MKFGLGQKRFKGAEVEFEHRGGWGRSLGMASFPTLPRYLLAGVLGLQLFILIILRGLPLPFPWLTPCPSDLTSNVETNSSNLVVAKNAINNAKDLGLGADTSDSGNAIDNASDLGDDRLDVGNGRFDLGSHNNASSDLGLESSVAVRKNNVSCDLGMVYVYRLPPVFNDDLLRDCDRLSPWKSFCPVILNSGYGDLISSDLLPAGQHGAWHKTDQFTGEIIFHKKLLEHPCVTDDPEKARAFYVPFYVGLAVGRYLWREYPAEVRDRDAKMALEWLQGQEPWRRNMGWDHFLMVGRITWDFRRSKDEDWGSSFLHMKEMQNTTRLLIERNPWDDKEMGVPYPTAFHPRSVEDVLRWQEHLRGVKRSQLFVFAGASRKFIPNDFRGILLDQCRKSRSCTSLNCSGQRCSNDTMVAVRLFKDSTFCLQPRGDSFTRRSIFDCLIAGSIPVFFLAQDCLLAVPVAPSIKCQQLLCFHFKA